MLPDAASLQRTDQVTRKIEAILKNIPEIQLYTTVNGNNLLNSTVAPNAATFFITLKTMGRKKETAAQIVQEIKTICMTKGFGSHRAGWGRHPSLDSGSGAGFTMMLQDRQGNSPQYLAAQAQKFIAAASQRLRSGGVHAFTGPMCHRKPSR